MMSLELKIAALANKPASETTFREQFIMHATCAFGSRASADDVLKVVDVVIMALAEKSTTIDAEMQKRIANFLRKTSCQARDWQANQILQMIDGTYQEE